MDLDLRDPVVARAVVTAGLAHELGRWPTKEEIKATVLTYLINN